MGRAILEQQPARQRPALALLAARPAALGLGRQTRRLQRKPRHGVAELCSRAASAAARENASS